MAHVVVGLGNPGAEYRDSRHNVGHRVLDHLARHVFEVPWNRDGPVLRARGRWRGELVTLVKPLAFMNVCGPVVAEALRRHHAGPEDLILVYDDLDLPLGTVRVRLRGSHGGHRGVRSVIEALGTQEFRRVKVGIGRPARKEDVVDYVLAPFAPDEWPTVQAAVTAAADRVLALIQEPPSHG